MPREQMKNWRELFPKGRDIYYEGETPKKFAQEIKAKFGFDPSSNNPCWNKQHGYNFYCPAKYLDAIYGNSKYPLGS